MARKRRHGKKHRKHHGRRRHNPAMLKGLGGTVMKIGLPAVAAGAAAGFIESKFLGGKSVLIRGLARVGMGLAAAVGLKRNPLRAAAAAGAIIGGIGNEQGIRLGGGLVLSSKVHGMQELAEEMSADSEMAEIFSEKMSGLGTVVEMRAIADDGGEVGDANVDAFAEEDAG